MDRQSVEKDPKVKATATIWSLAIGMLGVCIPLVAITESGLILPILVALSAGGGTVAVWLAPDKRQQEETDLAQTVKVLEERVINLETIYVSLPDAKKTLSIGGTNNSRSSEDVDLNLEGLKRPKL